MMERDEGKIQLLNSKFAAKIAEYDVVVQTDGGCRGNSPEGRANNCPCAWAYYIVKDTKIKFINQVGGNAIAYYGTKLTNNEAEAFAFSAVLIDLFEAMEYLYYDNVANASDSIPYKILLMSDSALLVNQLTGVWKINSNKKTIAKIKQTKADLESYGCIVDIMWIPREVNMADNVCNLAMDARKDIHVKI